MRKSLMFLVTMVAAAGAAVLIGHFVPAPLGDELRAATLVTSAVLLTASGLAVYFDWRGAMRRRVTAEGERREGRDRTA